MANLAIMRWLRGQRLRCSFCGRNADQVGRLVAGASAYICDACIKACVEILDRHGGSPRSPVPEQDGLTHA